MAHVIHHGSQRPELSTIEPDEYHSPASRAPDGFMDLRWVLDQLRQGWRTLALCLALAVGLAILATSFGPPLYRATTKVLFDNSGQTTDINELFTRRYSDLPPVQNEIEVLTSRDLAERVVDSLHLTGNPEFNPALRPEEAEEVSPRARIAALVDRVKSGIRTRLGREAEVAPDPAELAGMSPEERLRSEVVDTVMKMLAIRTIPNSRVVEIDITAETPETAAAIAQAFTEQYRIGELEFQIAQSQRAANLLTSRAEALAMEASGAEEAAQRKRVEIARSTGQSPEVTQQEISATTAEMTRVQNTVVEFETRENQLEHFLKEGGDPSGIPELLRSQAASGAITNRSNLMSERRQLLAVFSPTHDAVRRIDAQIAAAEEVIDSEARNLLTSVTLSLESSRSQVESLRRNLTALEALAREQEAQQVELRQLEYMADATHSVYEGVLERLHQISDAKGLGQGSMRVLAKADPPLRPVSSRRKLAVLAATLLGLGLGAGIICLRAVLGRSALTPRSVQAALGLPVIASVPEERHIRRVSPLRLTDAPRSRIIRETFRMIRSAIPGPASQRRIVMVASSVPGEGKTTVSTMLATSYWEAGLTVALVDCDLRKPTLLRALGIDPAEATPAGLTGPKGVETLCYRDPAAFGLELFTFRAASGSKVSPDMLGTEAFADLIRAIAAAKDIVIIDLPPTMVFADARGIVPLADRILYVVRWRSTSLETAAEGVSSLRARRSQFAGVVLSRVGKRAAARISRDTALSAQLKYSTYYDR
ncbi:GumC family protein [Amaricoccus solimangrovi]|uniref:Uncharacterized protein n=1 Tax=Amaricoccus solimangrovi TaxID=2589815 RepID=A0A501WIC7_9RHOB|nr:Wzz/FepE/Etk N-terminal domain-containing protein [Amaricoccus solimangrovi]TPE48175.1 hypothetical protein FJM51_18405 [Amaricoccus solimangrovi]